MSDARPLDRAALLESMVQLAIEAGTVVWDHYWRGVQVAHKADDSPVTAADHASEALILAGLRRACPHLPVVAEEEAAAGRIPAVSSAFLLVDPLDGTKEFIRGGTDFTINIALIEAAEPSLGVVYAPARSALYWGDVQAGQAWQALQPPHEPRTAGVAIRVRTPPKALCAVASKSHNTPATEAWLKAAGVSERVAIGSSLKFALIASGLADVYPRPAPTMEWDTAAGDALLRAAGGHVYDPDGRPLQYGKPQFRNSGFVASGPYQPAPLRPFMAAK